jgi:alanine dehydrogenase
MVIGVPKEIKTHEYRVAITPSGAAELIKDGHRVLIEESAGLGSGFGDEEYREAGAELSEKARVFAEANLIVKVKEPLGDEYGMLREGQAVFTFLHLAPNPELTELLLKKRITAFSYETLEDEGGLPLLAPMSEIAGRMSPLVAAFYLQRAEGGEGVLPTGATGVPPANILILGAGVVGTNAARVAHALGMRVTVINRGIERLRHIDEMFMGEVDTLPSTEHEIRETIKKADIVVGAVLVSGERAPVLITREMLGTMKKGSVIVDVSIDQGGCTETSRPTTHDEPVYTEEGVIHYMVVNMPGAYPRTSTLALTNSTLPYIRRLAAMGPEKAAREDAPLRTALNLHDGKVVHKGLAASIGMEASEP